MGIPTTSIVPDQLPSVADRCPRTLPQLAEAVELARRGDRQVFVALDEFAGGLAGLAGPAGLLLAQAEQAASGLREPAWGISVEDTITYDAYFGVTRVSTLGTEDLGIGEAPCFGALFRDLIDVRPVADDVHALLRLADTILRGDALAGSYRSCFTEAPSAIGPLDRWKLGHRVYALACRSSAVELDRAAELLVTEDMTGASASIEEAAEHVRAITAGMVHAAAIAADEYINVVRLTMAPPVLPVGLTGAMNLDYGAYKTSIDALLRLLEPSTFRQLAAVDERLAAAVDHLLNVDLVDLERHIELTHRLVGGRAALHENDGQSAVQALRAMYVVRLRRYGPLLRHGRITFEAFEASGSIGTGAWEA